jgi:hypothetical protein
MRCKNITQKDLRRVQRSQRGGRFWRKEKGLPKEQGGIDGANNPQLGSWQNRRAMTFAVGNCKALITRA